MLRPIYLMLLLVFIIACSSNKKSEPVAMIDGTPIFVSAVDSMIHAKLYERLYDIYYTRKIALDNMVARDLMLKEAVSRNISVDSLLTLEITSKATPQRLEQLIKDHQLELGIPDPNRYGKLMETYSPAGQKYLHEVLKEEIEREYITELKKKYPTEIFLSPPLPPRINLDDVVRYPVNESQSELEVVLVADFNCESCRSFYPVFKKLIGKYDKQVSFKFAPFSNLVSNDMMVCECASKDGNLSNVFHAFFEAPTGSVLKLDSIAPSLGIDYKATMGCVTTSENDIRKKLQHSFEAMSSKEISLTPTLIVDGRIYFGQMDLKSLEEYLENILTRKS